MTSVLSLRDVAFSRRLDRVGKGGTKDRVILHNVSLDIGNGERLGLIGENGAGKTTLLRIMAGILPPDAGLVERNCNISALLDTGYGLVEALSPRQNCESRLILDGYSTTTARKKVEEIESFIDIGEYFDQPMRSLSNGMYARTIFGLITAEANDVLLIDEGFGFIDEKFQRKAQTRLNDFYKSATALVIASHNFELLRQQCTRAIVLANGSVAFDGHVESAIDWYQRLMQAP